MSSQLWFPVINRKCFIIDRDRNQNKPRNKTHFHGIIIEQFTSINKFLSIGCVLKRKLQLPLHIITTIALVFKIHTFFFSSSKHTVGTATVIEY